MFMSIRMLSRQVRVPYATVWRAVRDLRLEPRRERGVLLLDFHDQLAVCEYLAARMERVALRTQKPRGLPGAAMKERR